LACIVAALALVAPAVAAPWVTFRGNPRCSASAEALAMRISAALAGDRDEELRVAIEIEAGGAGTTALVRLARGTSELGATRILATSCAEALEAAVLVAALALGTPPRALPIETPEPRPAPAAAPAPMQEQDHPQPVPSELGSGPTLRGLWSAGVDRGALAAATPILGLGLGASIGRDELRAQVAYGLPLSHERDETDTGFESTRTDFASLTVDDCRGLDGARALSLCAGLEGRLTRASELAARPDQPRSIRRRLAGGASAVAGASFVYRAATWQPRLDISLQLPLLGGAAGATPIGARAVVGGALPF
jgi:hypothetical protein